MPVNPKLGEWLRPGERKDMPSALREVSNCRIGGASDLLPILDLGLQALSGIFPNAPDSQVPELPLELVWSPSSGLVQLRHSANPGEMYGNNYGYRSGLNPTMVRHLQRKAQKLKQVVSLAEGDVVIDVGSNDGTLLNSFGDNQLTRIGFDPIAGKYKNMYDPEIVVVPEFFTAHALRTITPVAAKLVTSIAMFYDLENPNVFVREVAEVLSPDGVWHFEQSYLPAMLRSNSYDTICHEHLEYYSLRVVKNLLESHGMKILEVETNSVNGGSFAVTAALESSPISADESSVRWLLEQEDKFRLDTLGPYEEFSSRVFQHRKDLQSLVRRLRDEGQTVAAYGASTKGNVLLQFCGFGPEDIAFVAEVNPDKFGCFTPGSLIPIISEEEARALNPDYMLVLPWHFKDFIVNKEREYLAGGGRLIFPLPEIEIVS